MPPRARKVTPPPDLDGKTPANATSDLDALRAEVAAEPEGAADTLAVPLGDTVVRVKDFMDWPSSANEDLAYGRFTRWAAKVLDGDDFVKVWVPLDPTNRQVTSFLVDWEKISGIPLGTMLTSLTS